MSRLIFIWLQVSVMYSIRFQPHSKQFKKQNGLEIFFQITQFFHFLLAFILNAILDISKYSMMPERHHSDYSRTMYALPELIKKINQVPGPPTIRSNSAALYSAFLCFRKYAQGITHYIHSCSLFEQGIICNSMVPALRLKSYEDHILELFDKHVLV